MSWELILSEQDFRLYKENISLLEEQVVNSFTDSYRNTDILKAIRHIPRHFFVHPSYKYLAYTDRALPTYGSLTTSAPSVIAEILANLGLKPGDRVLEIGTGLGYEAAILAEMGMEVFTIEVDKQLARLANKTLVRLGYKYDKSLKENKQRLQEYNKIKELFPNRRRIRLFWGNGQFGLPEFAPFNGITIAASISQIKHVQSLISQLSKSGARLIVPIGNREEQLLHIVERKNDKLTTWILNGLSFNFVRMIIKL